jgi:hypothetical protein
MVPALIRDLKDGAEHRHVFRKQEIAIKRCCCKMFCLDVALKGCRSEGKMRKKLVFWSMGMGEHNSA